MIHRIFIILAASALLGAILIATWPPFPRPITLLDESFDSLTQRFGPSIELPSDTSLPEVLRPKKSISWTRSRIIAVWELKVDYTLTPFAAYARPDSIILCLAWRGLSVHFPCEAAFRGSVIAQTPRPPIVKIRVSIDQNSCSVREAQLPCEDAGAKLRAMGVAPGTAIRIIGDERVGSNAGPRRTGFACSGRLSNGHRLHHGTRLLEQ